VNPFRSVGIRLSLALAVMVAGALAVVWVALVPTLERRLVNGKIAQLTQSAKALQKEADAAGVDQDFVDYAAHASGARVVFLQPIAGGTQTAMLVLSDSLRFGFSADVRKDTLALRASTTGKLQHGRVGRDGTSYAEVAIPDKSGNVLLFASSLRDTLANDNLVGSRLLWAGLVALLIAMTVGYGASSVFARRIRRLEHAAERIAGGDFSEPVVDRRRDELGQLAAAFERMRLQLAQLDDARRAFIANASHELRTPIFSLSGFLELLRDEDLDEETQHEFLATMSEQVQRLSKLATDLLDLSRLDAGRMRLELEPVPLADAAHDLSREFSAVALRLEHPLDVVVEEDGVALADRERVIQIGRALVDNALVHTPEGTPVRIVVRGPVLSVEDDGPSGIPPEDADQVFARFTRLPGSKASGTGLGLAIARELAELMGGELRLQSEPGRTVFALELPAAVSEPEPAPILA
jgi:two-component system, OmpR family, sensor kinase